jgi:GrpB-like predicted nucleotidyltransferase (UPF0157 family)
VRHLAFRDYLISHPEVAGEYSALKRELATRFESDMAGYSEGKTAFISGVERIAATTPRDP